MFCHGKANQSCPRQDDEAFPLHNPALEKMFFSHFSDTFLIVDQFYGTRVSPTLWSMFGERWPTTGKYSLL